MEIQTELVHETNGVRETNGLPGINHVPEINGVPEMNKAHEVNGVYDANGVHRVNGHVGGAEGMKCESPTGINVLIVGAGLGGMFAAVELHRQGHQVRIIEAKEKMEGLGKFF